MNDELKMCARCHHEHKWGIVGYSRDNVPLYGSRSCEYKRGYAGDGENISVTGEPFPCNCNDFLEAIPGNENLPAMSQAEIKEIWKNTEFLNAQVPLATRIAVARIMSIGKGGKGFWATVFGGKKDRADAATLMEKQWPEFMGLMISQLTDIRGAMVRDESKFAHLVAHTDDVVEAMRGVVQLKERLDSINALNHRMVEQINKLTDEVRNLKLKGDPFTKSPQTLDEQVPRWEGADLCANCGHIKDLHRDEEGRVLPRISTPEGERFGSCLDKDYEGADPCTCSAFASRVKMTESAKVFSDTSRPLRDESISTDASASPDSDDPLD